MDATGWGTLATAAFAAIAAGASWESVLQTRRDRVAAATPNMSIDLITPLFSKEVRVQIVNHGAAVRQVEFAVATDGQISWSVAPRPTLLPGASLLLLTAIKRTSQAEPVGFVSCYDLTGRDLYAWWPQGEHRVYRVKDHPDERPSRAVLMRVVAPGFDITQAKPVTYEELHE